MEENQTVETDVQQTQEQVQEYNYNPNAAAPISKPPSENVLFGFVGAFIFALVGGLLYFGIYQIGIIAGICGFVTVALSVFGYGVFSKRRNSIKGVIIAIIISVVVLFIAEYLCAAFEIYKACQNEGYSISFGEVLDRMSIAFEESEFTGAFVKELLICYALSAVASFTFIKRTIAENKKQKA